MENNSRSKYKFGQFTSLHWSAALGVFHFHHSIQQVIMAIQMAKCPVKHINLEIFNNIKFSWINKMKFITFISIFRFPVMGGTPDKMLCWDKRMPPEGAYPSSCLLPLINLSRSTILALILIIILSIRGSQNSGRASLTVASLLTITINAQVSWCRPTLLEDKLRRSRFWDDLTWFEIHGKISLSNFLVCYLSDYT